MALSTAAAARKDKTTGKVEMQHRHFTTIAAIIAGLRVHEPSRSHIIKHFADELAATNPKFDRTRFIAACRATEGE